MLLEPIYARILEAYKVLSTGPILGVIRSTAGTPKVFVPYTNEYFRSYKGCLLEGMLWQAQQTLQQSRGTIYEYI